MVAPTPPNKPSPARKRKHAATSSSARNAIGTQPNGVSTGMPEIAGVPPSLIPLLVQALRSTHRFLAHRSNKALPPNFYMIQQHQQQQQTLSSIQRSQVNVVPDGDDTDGTMARRPRRNDDGTAVVDDILHRLQESNPAQIEQKQKQRQREDQMIQAIQSWLRDMITGYVRTKSASSNPDPTSAIQQQQQQQQKQSSHYFTSVPLACFQFVWELQWPEPQNDTTTATPQPTQSPPPPRSITARRAALQIAGLLLQKSSECRQFWCHGGEGSRTTKDVSIQSWIHNCLCRMPSNTARRGATAEESSSSSSLALYQQEAYRLLKQLLQEGYGDLYPQLHVAQRLLEQTCPSVLTPPATNGDDDDDDDGVLASDSNNNNNNNSSNGSTNSSNPWEWRRNRDLAMKHVTQETVVVHKLVQRAYACLQILAPSWDYDGVMNSAIATTTTTLDSCNDTKVIEAAQDGAADDHDDVDWEDGFDDNHALDDEAPAPNESHKNDKSDNDSSNNNMAPSDDHQSAVKRTLALMKAAGTLRGGQLEVAFQKNDNDEDLHPSTESSTAVSDTAVAARTRLLRCITKLQQVHMPRLSAWVEGLTHADGLVQAVGAGTSWVLMPSDQLEQRGNVQSQLLTLKQTVASVLASAARLGVKLQPTLSSSSQQSTTSETPTQVDSAVTTRMIPAREFRSLQPASHSATTRRMAAPSTASRLKTKRFHRIQIQYRCNK